jgi:tetratricopeptide (TPR) repeat protein
MHRKFFLASSIILVSVGLATAQSVTSQNSGAIARTEKPIVVLGKKTDLSTDIDPLSVDRLSDDELDQIFNKMISEYSRNAVLFNNIGASYFTRKQFDKAENAFRRAIILNNHPAFLTNLSIVYDTEKRIPEAISAAQRAVAQSPRYVRARTQLCELMMVSKRNQDSELCYEELSKITQLDALSQTYYALVILRGGEPQKAIDMISEVLKNNQPTALMYNTLGKAYYEKKRYTQSANAFKEAVQIDPNNPQLRYNLALSLTASDDRAGALSQYNLMKTNSPDLADQLYRALYSDKIIYVNGATATTKVPRN